MPCRGHTFEQHVTSGGPGPRRRTGQGIGLTQNDPAELGDDQPLRQGALSRSLVGLQRGERQEAFSSSTESPRRWLPRGRPRRSASRTRRRSESERRWPSAAVAQGTRQSGEPAVEVGRPVRPARDRRRRSPCAMRRTAVSWPRAAASAVASARTCSSGERRRRRMTCRAGPHPMPEDHQRDHPRRQPAADDPPPGRPRAPGQGGPRQRRARGGEPLGGIRR